MANTLLKEVDSDYRAWDKNVWTPQRSGKAFTQSKDKPPESIINLGESGYLISGQGNESSFIHHPVPEVDTSFDLDEILHKTKFIRLLSELKSENPWPYTNELVNRIKILWEYAQEEEGQKPLSANSLKRFVAFMKANSWIRKPGLTLSYDGEISPIWRRAKNMHCSMLFCENDVCRYVLRSPSADHEKTYVGASGEILTNRVISLLETYEAVDWLKQDG